MHRILIILAVLIVVIPAALVAQGWNDPDNDFENCKLTAEQREQIADIRTEQQKEMIDLRAKLEKFEIDNREAMRDEDWAAARKLTEKIFQVQSDIAKLHIDMMEDVSKILSDEQKEAWRGNHMMMRGMGFGPGFGSGQCGNHPGMQQMHRRGAGMQGGCGGHMNGEGHGQHGRMQEMNGHNNGAGLRQHRHLLDQEADE